jgi:hypothetical protein
MLLQIAQREIRNQYYSALSYTTASTVVHVPFTFIILLLFFTCVLSCDRMGRGMRVAALDGLCPFFSFRVSYFMSGLSRDSEDYFLFIAVAFSMDTAVAAFYRFSVYLSPTALLAEVRAAADGSWHIWCYTT